VTAGRARIDEIDDELMRLIRDRVATSRDIQRARIAAGGSRVDPSRERELVRRWQRELGEAGQAIALQLLVLCRGSG
jgi:chorismate mutase